MGYDLALVPDMVAGGHAVRAGCIERFGNAGRDAEAVGRILAVDDRAVDGHALTQHRQVLDNRLATAFADDISEKQEPHGSIRVVIRTR